MNYGSKKIRKQQKEVPVKPPLVDKETGRRRRNSIGGMPSSVEQLNVQLPLTQQQGKTGAVMMSNQFALLSDDEEEDVINGGANDATAAAQWSKKCGDAVNNSVNCSVPSFTKIRCPPIFVYGSSVSALNQMISMTSVTKNDYGLRVGKATFRLV
ncbi:uncharacterized protein LOC134210170 [Armigeres subalbatus]|uniref:uncharacterized protein LOC134210170 n=1 Tax=Armigeres subalbatus TaxID=124917 RepID=UPI002ED46BF2